MTDAQFEKIKKGLNFHSEGGIDNLCMMTETTLRAILDDATKELEAQIEKMKCCYNCSKWNEGQCENIKDGYFFHCADFGCDKWEIKEND